MSAKLSKSERYKIWAAANKDRLRQYYHERQKRRTADEPTRLAYNAHRRKQYKAGGAALRARKNAYAVKWRKANPEKQKRIQLKALLKRDYNMTIEDYESMVVLQAGKCAICNKPPYRDRLDVDHSHITGKVRKLLCNV